MNHMRTKLVVAGTILALAVSYLAFAGVKQGWVYYVDVDAFAGETHYHGQRVRLCGSVAAENLAIDPAALTARFNLLGKNTHVLVAYHGVVPEMFRPGGMVVVEGASDEQGLFHADLILTKCASKYEERVSHAESRPWPK
jgi:cytochrome c-type biogenesis protein CcmE